MDRLAGGRRVPLGAWSTFANHGTVNHSTFGYYNADHHAAAARVFEAAVRPPATWRPAGPWSTSTATATPATCPPG